MDPLVANLGRRDALSSEEKEVLASIGSTPRRYKAGEDLVCEGDRPHFSTLVVSGFTARFNTLSDGGRQISAIHVSGDFVDLHSFPLHLMDHGVVALSDCNVQAYPHEELRRITENHPHLTRLLWLSTLIDAAIHRRWLVAMGRQTAVSQLAHLICELRVRLEIVDLATARGYDLPLTQQQLGDVLGLSQVHVNRVVQELKARKLIGWASKKVTLLNWDGLVELAEFDPIYLNLIKEPR